MTEHMSMIKTLNKMADGRFEQAREAVGRKDFVTAFDHYGAAYKASNAIIRELVTENLELRKQLDDALERERLRSTEAAE